MTQIVGTISQLSTLQNLTPEVLQVCDLGEIRFDAMALTEVLPILPRCQQVRAWPFPLLFTVRLQSEGGQWPNSQDEARLPFFLQAMEMVDWLDIELNSALFPRLLTAATAMKKTLIVSYHDFTGTPSLAELQRLLSRIAAVVEDPNGVIVKIVTTIRARQDHFVLLKLLEQEWGISLCVFGMGVRGMGTRVFFPLLGSRMTYGYLDTVSAPGQLSCRDLTNFLSQIDPDYAADKQCRLAALYGSVNK